MFNIMSHFIPNNLIHILFNMKLEKILLLPRNIVKKCDNVRLFKPNFSIFLYKQTKINLKNH